MSFMSLTYIFETTLYFNNNKSLIEKGVEYNRIKKKNYGVRGMKNIDKGVK